MLNPRGYIAPFIAFLLTNSSVISAPSKEDTGRAIKWFEEGVRHYKSSSYKEALTSFIKSLRFAQDHQTLYYKALTISKLQSPCEDITSAWRNYVDYCKLDESSNCKVSWLKKAQEKHERSTKRCTPKSKATRGKSVPQTQVATPHPQRLRLKTSMICRIKKGQRLYQQLKVCNGEYLQEDDQLRLEVSANKDGHLYIILLSDRGQLQLVYPEGQEHNKLIAQKNLKLPSNPYYEGWWPVDHIKNEKERLIIIFTKHPDPTLEKMRGANYSPDQAKTFLSSSPAIQQALTKWSALGESSESSAQSVIIHTEGTEERAVIQYYFQHE